MLALVVLLATAGAGRAEPAWRRTIEAVGAWQPGLGDPGFWCRDDARTGLWDLRQEAMRECAATDGGGAWATPVEEEVVEGTGCRVRQEVVCGS